MEFGDTFSAVPTVPIGAQPKDLAKSQPGGEEQTFGSFLSGAAPAGAMGVNGQVPADMPEQTFGEATAQPTLGDRAAPTSNPNAPRQVDQEISAQDAEVDRTVAELRSELPASQRKHAEAIEGDDELSALTDQLRNEIGENPPGTDQFDENAGIAAPGSGPLDAIGQAMRHGLTRVRAGLGRNNTEIANAYKSRYGDENVQSKDGELWFRRGANEKFRRVDRKGLANGLDLLEDLLSDNSGPLVEGVVTAMTEAGLITAGSMNPAVLAASAMVPGVAPALTVGAMATGAAAGSGARQGLISAVDAISDKKQRDEDVSLMNETAWNLGMNATVMGLGGAGKWGVNKVFKPLMADLPKNRIKALADIKNNFDDFAKTLGIDTEKVKQGLRKTGERVFDVVDKTHEKLTGAVKMVESKAKEIAKQQGIESVPVTNGLNKLKEVLDRNFVEFDENGMASLSKGKGMSETEQNVASDMFGEGVVSGAVAHEGAAADANTMAAFGTHQGPKILNRMIDQYNSLKAATDSNGGVPLETLFNVLDSWDNMSKFGFDPKGAPIAGEQAAYRELRHAVAGDRDAALKKLLTGSGTAEESIYKTAYQNMTKQIDDVVQFRSMFNKRESAAAFAESLVQPQNVERIQKLKSVLGNDSKEWNAVRGEWFNSLVDKATSKSSGVLDSNSLLKDFGSYGKEVLNEMMSKEEQGQVRKMAVSAGKIPYEDLLTVADKDALQSLIAFSPAKQFQTSRFRTLWKFIGANKYAADYLLDEGFMEAAKKAKDKPTREGVMGLLRFTQEMVNRMRTVKVPRTDPKTGKKALVDILVPIGQAGRQMIVQPHLTERRAATPMPDEMPTEQEINAMDSMGGP